MSKEQEKNLPKASGSMNSHSGQAENDTHSGEIIHPDGRRESVEIHSARMWSGILPRPEDFAKFGEVVPDAPERLLRMAELEQQHRISIEAKIIPENQKAGSRGQWLGAGISALALILAAWSSYLGSPWQLSIALVGVPVLSVARSLVMAYRNPSE